MKVVLFSEFYVVKDYSMNVSEASVEEIKKAFIKSCLTFDPSCFKPFLYAEKFACDIDRRKFFRLFKNMLAASKAQSEGELTLKIENKTYEGRGVTQYCFYDAVHKYARLSVNVVETKESVNFEILPF